MERELARFGERLSILYLRCSDERSHLPPPLPEGAAFNSLFEMPADVDAVSVEPRGVFLQFSI